MTLAGSGNPHRAHFQPASRFFLGERDVTQIAEFRTVMLFNQAMITQFATFPLGSSSGGFTFDFDAASGTYTQRSQSFGPSFAERALTIGRRKLSVGTTFQRATYDRFEGRSLDEAEIRFYIEHNDCCPGQGTAGRESQQAVGDGTLLNPGFEGDLVEAALSVRAETNTFAVFFNYGLTDSWDVGAAIPFVSVDLAATVQATILRLATSENPRIHSFDELGGNQKTFSQSGVASGLGDILLRTKYQFLRRPKGGLAAALDLRLPTGEELDLLGTGATTAKIYFIASGGDRISPHVNVGYTFAGSNEPLADFIALDSPFLRSGLRSGDLLPDEIDYAAGVDLLVAPNLSVVADVIGRTLRDAGRLAFEQRRFQFRRFRTQTAPPTEPEVRDATFSEFVPREGDLTLVLGALGAKFNPRGSRFLLSGNLLFPFTYNGLQDTLTIMFGLDYAF